jgi:23S rRNA (cytosine1962-C5)-methyltransferase
MTLTLTPTEWRDYELLDCGEYAKLERFGQFITVRPDPRAIWRRSLPRTQWDKAEATFVQSNNGDEEWVMKEQLPDEWVILYKNLKFKLRLTDFRHVGVFPEQAVNWEWITSQIQNSNNKQQNSLKILNLFAYTGGATMAAVQAGAQVTHVDASRPTMMWASENAQRTGLPKEAIRWIQDDAMKFVQREIRRGVKYDGIIMDPPRFGRGANGEIWKLEDDLPKLVEESRKILSETPLFFLINAYTADLSSIAVRNLLSGVMKNSGGTIESGEIGLTETGPEERILPAGIFARWNK